MNISFLSLHIINFFFATKAGTKTSNQC